MAETLANHTEQLDEIVTSTEESSRVVVSQSGGIYPLIELAPGELPEDIALREADAKIDSLTDEEYETIRERTQLRRANLNKFGAKRTPSGSSYNEGLPESFTELSEDQMILSWFLNHTPLPRPLESNKALRRVMSELAGSEHLDDPEVMERFKLVQRNVLAAVGQEGYVVETPEDLLALLIMERPEWHAAASCRGMNPDLFFPNRGASYQETKEICRGCIVKDICLEENLYEGPGIYGGMGSTDRKRYRRRNGL